MTSQPAEAAPSFSALIIDDNVAWREAIAFVLEHSGWQVATASDAGEGLEAVRIQRFDVVITDVRMHRRGGLSLLEQVLEIQPDLWDKFVFIRRDRQGGPVRDPASLTSAALTALQSEVERIVQKANGKASRRST